MSPVQFERHYPTPDVDAINEGLWFLIRKDTVYVHMRDGALGLPQGEPPSLPMRHVLRLGVIGDDHVHAALLADDVELPSGARLLGLRELYGRIDEHHYGIAGYAAQMLNWQRDSNFCMRCGTALLPMRTEWGKQCPNCNWLMYPPVNPCTITLIHDGDRVLLTHKDGWGPRYGLVAGFVEPGESFEDSLRREVKEEVRVSVGKLDYFRSQPWPFPHQIMVGFFAEYSSGDVAIDTRELDDARWFHIDELPVIPPPMSIARQLLDHWISSRGRTPPLS
jgi:NAD+ diphosphatase